MTKQSSPQQTDEKCKQQTQAPQQNALARLLRVTQPPSLISVLADGQAAIAVHHAITPLAATKGLRSDTFMMVAPGDGTFAAISRIIR